MLCCCKKHVVLFTFIFVVIVCHHLPQTTDVTKPNWGTTVVVMGMDHPNHFWNKGDQHSSFYFQPLSCRCPTMTSKVRRDTVDNNHYYRLDARSRDA